MRTSVSVSGKKDNLTGESKESVDPVTPWSDGSVT